jgi:hypothetical protein
MIKNLAVTTAITTIAEAEKRFNLSRATTTDFFKEWQNLENIPQSYQSEITKLYQRYLYHRSLGNLLENTVMLLLVSPLLAITGLYDPPFQIKAEESIEIVLTDSEEILTGRIDVLVLNAQIWVIVLESKKTMLSVWSALPQTLAYMMANPSKHSCFGIFTNGDNLVFLKLKDNQYELSRVFSPLSSQSDLETACQILLKLSNG